MAAPWAGLLALALAGGWAHPMHTAVTEVVQDDAGDGVSVRVRVFTDDFQIALPRTLDSAIADSAMARYLRGTLALADGRGRPVRLRWDGAERTGDVLVLRLRGEVPGGLAGARITSLVLCERFEDQVNVVRAFYRGRATTLLFTRGDQSKPLP